jgi:3-methyladenine DNA glycosylase/8-oxoguanine DNA glycosylase
VTGALRVRAEPDAPVDLLRTCGALREGRTDPTWHVTAELVERSAWTAAGPASLRVRRVGPRYEADAWGPGAPELAATVPALLGLHDDPRGFRPELHPLVHRTHRRVGPVRVGAGRQVLEALVPQVLGQRVTAREAHRSWRQLVVRHGAAAPGPVRVRLAPSPRALCRLGVADWHVLGVERQRADTIRRCVSLLGPLRRAAEAGSDELQRVLRTIPGVGPWTATGLAATVAGDPDAVLLGDLHLPHTVCHALAGEPRGDDARMLELLAPWAGHRLRVVRLIGAAGVRAPRRGPRYAPLPIARW